MGHFRFRRSIGNKYFRLNLSKSGISTSVGIPGARINIGGRGRITGTAGLPGTGLSYRHQLGSGGGSYGRTVYKGADGKFTSDKIEGYRALYKLMWVSVTFALFAIGGGFNLDSWISWGVALFVLSIFAKIIIWALISVIGIGFSTATFVQDMIQAGKPKKEVE